MHDNQVSNRPPSRIRYEKQNPTVSVRVPLEVRTRIRTLAARTGRTPGRILREALLGKVSREQELADRAHRAGYEEARAEFSVTFPCARCGKPETVRGDAAKAAAGEYMSSAGWAHGECPQATPDPGLVPGPH